MAIISTMIMMMMAIKSDDDGYNDYDDGHNEYAVDDDYNDNDLEERNRFLMRETGFPYGEIR